MGFFELGIGNGCDTCEPVNAPNNVNNVNMYTNNNSSMPYGTQNNSAATNYNNSMSSGSGYQGSSNMSSNNGMGNNNLSNQNMVSHMGQQTIQTTQPTMVMVPATTVSTTTTNNGQVVKQVIVPTHTASSSTNATLKMEGFTDGNMHNGSNNILLSNNKNWVVLGFVVFTALASNECCKYFLNKSLQLNDGSPLYYVAYIIVAMLLTYSSIIYTNKN